MNAIEPAQPERPSDGPIVVGVGDDYDDVALAWAAREASAVHRSLHVVHAFVLPMLDVWNYDDVAEVDAVLQSEAEKDLQGRVARLRDAYPDLELQGQVSRVPSSTLLLDRSRSASLIVVGSHRLGHLDTVFLGSVSAAVARSARCPTVVLPPHAVDWLPGEEPGAPPPAGPGRPVVIGIDTDNISRAGTQRPLCFGLDHAARHDAPVTVISCVAPHRFASVRGSWRTTLKRRLDDRLAEVLVTARARHPQVSVTAHGVIDHPASALSAAGHDAGLLVVGRRSHGVGRCLGSVSQAVIHAGTCPVAIVPN